MLLPNDIGDAIEERVKALFEGEEFYREMVPSDFSRPSSFLQLADIGTGVNFGTGIVEIRPLFELSTFVKVDEYYHSHLQEIDRRLFLLLGLFLPGFVKVGDRAPHVKQLTAESGYDFGTVRARFEFTLDRGNFTELEEHQEMLNLHLREEITTNG